MDMTPGQRLRLAVTEEAPLSAFRAANAAALAVYQTSREHGAQQEVIELMQTHEELYEYLGYNAFEENLDALFSKNIKQED